MQEPGQAPANAKKTTKKIQLALAVYAVLLLLLALPGFIYMANTLSSSQRFWLDIGKNPTQFKDFRLYYAYGKLASGNEHDRLYDFDKQSEYYQRYAADKSACDPNFRDYVPYPPQFSLLAMPLAQLDLYTAYRLWTVAGLVAGMIGLAQLGRRFASLTPWQLALLLLACFASLPGRQCLVAGQTSWLLAGICSWYFLALVSGRQLSAGVCLAIAAVKPPFALALAAAALAGRQYKTLTVAAAITLVLLVIAICLLGVPILPAYLAALGQLGTTSQFDAAFRVDAMVSLRSVLVQILPARAALSAANFFFLAGLGGIYLAFARTKLTAGERLGWACAVLTTAYLLLAPHVHQYDCLLLSVPMTMLASGLILQPGSDRPASQLIWSWLVVSYPLTSCLAYLLLPGTDHTSQLLGYNQILLLLNAIFLRLAIKQMQVAAQQDQKDSADAVIC